MHLSKRVQGTLIKGHQVASGKSSISPYPAGTIALQKPFFEKLGLDLSKMFDGTLNIQLNAKGFSIVKPDWQFEQLQWIDGFNSETFSFVAVELEYANVRYPAWVYYPHPETKTKHFQAQNLVEILAPKIDGLTYGDEVTLCYSNTNLLINPNPGLGLIT